MPSDEGNADDAGGASAEGPPKDKKDLPGGKKPFRHGGYQKSAAAMPRQPKFEGKCDELKGQIYDCSDSRQSDMFTKSTKEIAEYVGRTYKYGGDISWW